MNDCLSDLSDESFELEDEYEDEFEELDAMLLFNPELIVCDMDKCIVNHISGNNKITNDSEGNLILDETKLNNLKFNVDLINYLKNYKCPIMLYSNNFHIIVEYISKVINEKYNLKLLPFGLGCDGNLMEFIRYKDGKIISPLIVYRNLLLCTALKYYNFLEINKKNILAFDDNINNYHILKNKIGHCHMITYFNNC